MFMGVCPVGAETGQTGAYHLGLCLFAPRQRDEAETNPSCLSRDQRPRVRPPVAVELFDSPRDRSVRRPRSVVNVMFDGVLVHGLRGYLVKSPLGGGERNVAADVFLKELGGLRA